MSQHCDWCGDPATRGVSVGNIKGRLCDNCAADAENEFESYTDTDGIMK